VKVEVLLGPLLIGDSVPWTGCLRVCPPLANEKPKIRSSRRRPAYAQSSLLVDLKTRKAEKAERRTPIGSGDCPATRLASGWIRQPPGSRRTATEDATGAERSPQSPITFPPYPLPAIPPAVPEFRKRFHQLSTAQLRFVRPAMGSSDTRQLGYSFCCGFAGTDPFSGISDRSGISPN
jgi:hypothetical protein